MVSKRQRIARKPTTPPAEADNWVREGGTDPEIQAPAPQTEIQPEAQPEQPVPTDKAKAYPHRVSFDMETPQYKRLKRASFEEERAMNEILREAVEDWLKTRDY